MGDVDDERLPDDPAVAWRRSYTGGLRQLVGDRTLIVPGPRAVIENEAGEILFVRRSDDGRWVMPAGQIELGESIHDALVREVREETGLLVEAATPIALYTEDRFSFVNAYGASHQMFAVVFHVTRFSGELITSTDETTGARFFRRDALPETSMLYLETLDDLDRFGGTLVVK